MHTAASTALSFAILFGAVGYSFIYVSGNTVELPPQVGIDVLRVTPEIAEALGMQEARGLLVTAVAEGSPADRAGLRPVSVEIRDGQQVPVSWDVIVEMDGTSVNNEEDVRAALEGKQLGDSMRLTVVRNNETISVNLILK